MFWYWVGNLMKNLCIGLVNLVNDLFYGVFVEFRGIRKEFYDGIRVRIVVLWLNGLLSI